MHRRFDGIEVGVPLVQPIRQPGLANFCQTRYLAIMSTMNISLPESLKTYVDQQVDTRGYGTSSEYVRELIRKDQDIQKLRNLLMDGAASPQGAESNSAYFEGLRNRIKQSGS